MKFKMLFLHCIKFHKCHGGYESLDIFISLSTFWLVDTIPILWIKQEKSYGE